MSDLSFLQGLSLPPHLHRKDAISLTYTISYSWNRIMKFGSSIETCLTVPQFKVEPFWTILRVLFGFFPMTPYDFSDFLCIHVFLMPLFLNPSNCALENCTKPAQYTLISYWGQGSLPLKKSSFFLWFLAYFSGEDRNFCKKIWGKILQIWINIEHLVNNYNTRTAQNPIFHRNMLTRTSKGPIWFETTPKILQNLPKYALKGYFFKLRDRDIMKQEISASL